MGGVILGALTGADLSRHTILAVAVIVVVAHASGSLARRIGQPRVLGEIVGGIVLGPSVLGAAWPEATSRVFPAEVVGQLKPLSDIGLILFMFVVGMELDRRHLRGQRHRAVVVSHVSIILPFVGGALLAWWLHGVLDAPSDLLPFCLFVGAAMAVTAFPVLARILQETGLDRTPVGAMALTCAAVDDVTAWCILAAVLAVAGGGGVATVLATLAWSLAFGAAMWWVVRPLLARYEVPLALALGLAFASAWTTDLIGIHALFGAFLAGTVMPERKGDKLVLADRLSAVTDAVLLPVFFMLVGLSTRLGLLDEPWLWGIAAVVTLVAVAGKLGGATVAARLTGESWRDATTIGLLMNTRGLTEIVILTVGLERGLIDDTMFTIMVVMALATTIMAVPVLRRANLVPEAGAPAVASMLADPPS
ncbi:cation:proton antiporter [Aquihabitans sp. G128]|uniref:cation:proton antiporter n=1 Tax=Aquihabitans sp. G128 TaxID=2849779 RepID=UPI001C2302B0|nr:cation:proton antiporter [Aquihabitans sp. G128]QXC60344.1 cation:proton antiporter [Aquihabitans sp. G128]